MCTVRWQRLGALGFGTIILVLIGCSFGPLTIYTNRLKYNTAVRQTWNDEFLLNIVRLRYRDPPQWDAITSILASSEFDAGTSYSESIHALASNRGLGLANGVLSNSNLFNAFTPGLTGAISERPTVSYSPLEGPDFTRGLLQPIHLEHIQLLASTGWDVDRVLRVAVVEMNHLENAKFMASFPEPAPVYEPFAEVAHKLRVLQVNDMLEFTYDTFPKQMTHEAWAIDKMSPSDLISATDKMYFYKHWGTAENMADKSGKPAKEDKVLLFQHEKTPVARVRPEAWTRFNETAEVAQILNLIPCLTEYKLIWGAEGGQFKYANEPSDKIVLTTRSCLDTLILASRGVEVPQKHIEQGLVGLAMDENCQPFDWKRMMADLIQIHHQKTRPLHAFATIKYHGYWFYIDENDLNSKNTFALIIELYGLELAGGVLPAPLVTIPVGNGLQATPAPAGGGGGGGKKGGG